MDTVRLGWVHLFRRMEIGLCSRILFRFRKMSGHQPTFMGRDHLIRTYLPNSDALRYAKYDCE